jgi:mRNA interferase RelE/StbE
LAWTIEFDPVALKDLRKLGRSSAARITAALDKLALQQNPRDRGKALAGEWAGHWRYRIGDYRVIARIEDGRMVIVVVALGHRREVYR